MGQAIQPGGPGEALPQGLGLGFDPNSSGSLTAGGGGRVGRPELAPPGSADDHVDLFMDAIADVLTEDFEKATVVAAIVIGRSGPEVHIFDAGLELVDDLHRTAP